MNDKHFESQRKALLRQLWEIAKEKGITHEEIGIRAGFQQGHVTRALAGRYAISLDNLLKLSSAVDCTIEIKPLKK